MFKTYVMPLDAAKGCLQFTQRVASGSIVNTRLGYLLPQEEVEKFQKEINSFVDYLLLMINSEIQEIEIPEHHRRMFEAISQVGLLASLLEVPNDSAKKKGE